MTRHDYLVLSLVSLLMGLVILAAYELNRENKYPKPLSHERIVYLKDSLEMEYYKNLLEESFFFEHSKIPDNESNTGVQSTR